MQVIVPEEQWVVMMDRVEALERQQNRLFGMIEALGNRIDSSNLNAEVKTMKVWSTSL